MNSLLLFAVIHAAQAEPARLPFTDSCSSDPSFAEYRSHFWKAVSRKDVAALRPLVSPTVRNSFGHDESEGWPALVRAWALDRPETSGIWNELTKVLSLGCEEVGGERYAPGNLTKLGEYDEPLVYVAVKKGAALRSGPDVTAPIVMTLHNHVLFDAGGAPEGWLRVRLTDGQSGYVRSSDARSAIDYRAHFMKVGGRWLMTSFIAGD